MKIHAVKVEKALGEQVRAVLRKNDLLHREYPIPEQNGYLLLPIIGPLPDAVKADLQEYSYELVSLNNPEKRPQAPEPVEIIASRCGLPENKKQFLMRKWELLGDVLVLKFPEELSGYREELAEVYADVLGAKTVLEELSGITGEVRRPDMEIIYGNDPVTVHVENGIKYKLNVKELMFSSGNVSERLRVAEFQCKDEVIVDMFAGIGYFTLPLACYTKPKQVYACELNPVSFDYLKDNIKLNEVEDVITPVLGDCRKTAPEGKADRIMMGLIKNTSDFLPKAMSVLKKEGGFVHYHDTVPEEDIPDVPFSLLRTAGEDAGFNAELLQCIKIKSYAPGIMHVVLDVNFKKEI